MANAEDNQALEKAGECLGVINPQFKSSVKTRGPLRQHKQSLSICYSAKLIAGPGFS